MMRANVERIFDDYEREANIAIMREKAHRAKRPKSTDLYKRPKDLTKQQKKAEDMRKKSEETMAWISQFEEFEYVGKEETHG